MTERLVVLPIAIAISFVVLALVAGCGATAPVAPAVAVQPPVQQAARPGVSTRVQTPESAVSRVEVSVTREGFVPGRLAAKRGTPITLVITRTTNATCAREILFEDREEKTDLPLGVTVEVTYVPKTTGEVRFGCAMGMMVGGVLVVE